MQNISIADKEHPQPLGLKQIAQGRNITPRPAHACSVTGLQCKPSWREHWEITDQYQPQTHMQNSKHYFNNI